MFTRNKVDISDATHLTGLHGRELKFRNLIEQASMSKEGNWEEFKDSKPEFTLIDVWDFGNLSCDDGDILKEIADMGINLEVDDILLPYFESLRNLTFTDRMYYHYRSGYKTSHDFSRLNMGLMKLSDPHQIILIALSLIWDVYHGRECPLSISFDSYQKTLDLGYWHDQSAGVYCPQNVCVENLLPTNRKRINFHIHSEAARFYKPERQFLVERTR